ncbi:MAG: septum formation inhibitor [Bacteroidales bacterium]|jgi:cell division protein FtsB|nr:septum formation inhibitor [Bacteroidales bacterium]
MMKVDIMRYFPPLFRNKFIFSFLLFFVWLTIIDTNSLIERTKNIQQVHQLEKDKLYYEKKIQEDHEKLQELESNRENLEKFAREQYLMKRENEDIFIIEK